MTTQSMQVKNLVGEDFMLSVIEALLVENGLDKEPRAVQDGIRTKMYDQLTERIAAFIMQVTPEEKIQMVLDLADQQIPYSAREQELIKLVPNFQEGMREVLALYQTQVRSAFKNF